MFVPARLRRSIILFLVMVVTGLGLFLVIFPNPDLSEEMILLRRMADLSIRVKHAEQLNAERKHEMQSLFQQFSTLTRLLASKSDSSEVDVDRILADEVAREDALNRRLGLEALALIKGANWTYDLSLPSIYHFLPYLTNSPKSLIPAFKLSKRQKTQVSTVLGIPTVKRSHQSYLGVTLKSIVDNMDEEEMDETLVIVFVAETDIEFVRKVAEEIERDFAEHVASGLIEVVSPPTEYYPDFAALRKTLGDEMERVVWRSKQNLDYAFLMMYAHWRGHFYVQLEDDVLTKPGFVSVMKNYALERTARKEPWFVIDYCQLGFIGKLFKSTDLPTLIQFFLMFYNDKPVDWLLENVLQTMVCKLDQDAKKCKKEKSHLWIHYKPSLFQHIGTHSSLKGKVQKLKDKQFGKIPMFVPHLNPQAQIETVIQHYKSYSLTRAYAGETFYWGLVPQAGDTITFHMNPPIALSGFKFVSGNAEHPSDRFAETTVEVKLESRGKVGVPSSYEQTSDGTVIVGAFDSNGVAAGEIDRDWGKVSQVRLSVHKSSDNWVILSEMHIKT